ncbi:hypothetical protein, partial [Hydrotalea sp.]|uniref:hypothetical protein n=1 Tax=Hydrotalea sp. TaxID=2881279 RepID=UPI002606C9B8
MKPITINKSQPSMGSAVVFSLARPQLTTAFIICFISIMFSGISSMLMSVYLPVAVKDLLGNVTEEKI